MALGHIVVAFNASYDLTVMDAEGKRLGFPALEFGTVADPYVIDREMDRTRSGKRTLAAVCDEYGVTLTCAHEARRMPSPRVISSEHSSFASLSSPSSTS